jgi:histone H1
MTKHVISPKKFHVIKKPKSARKILQNKFKPIKNIKLQNIFTKNPKKSRLGTPPA